jgi:Skp family chaperone for outer membrane proteins
MTTNRGVLTVFVVAVVLSVMFASTVYSAPAEALNIACIDLDKVFDGYDKKAKLEEELRAQARSIEDQLKLRDDNKLLTDEEFKQLVELRSKPSPSAEEKQKIDQLLALSKERDKTFQALQQKTELTDAEKAQLTEFQNRVKAVRTALQEELAKKDEELRRKQVDLSKQVYADIENVVAAIAKEKGLTLVLNKTVNNIPFVVYAKIDITEEALNKLNKK